MSIQVGPLNDGADALAARFVTVSLHTGDPGDTGTNELSGGAYTRVQASWAPASDGLAEISENLVYQVPAGNMITHVGMWDANDNWAAAGELTESQPFNNDGELTIQTLTVSLSNE